LEHRSDRGHLLGQENAGDQAGDEYRDSSKRFCVKSR
jgi:hypothetical protein